ncbi:hypothetical protein DFH09DRAFT_1464128 [Mycena vulgaris]|nr:hypothetical protein DFH09DRAFT_1288668 [Mycena vulgaris]KAJ6570454.1 hypothetical protein DFH09DRAFT_1464128 [Mycena vulgaris]
MAADALGNTSAEIGGHSARHQLGISGLYNKLHSPQVQGSYPPFSLLDSTLITLRFNTANTPPAFIRLDGCTFSANSAVIRQAWGFVFGSSNPNAYTAYGRRAEVQNWPFRDVGCCGTHQIPIELKIQADNTSASRRASELPRIKRNCVTGVARRPELPNDGAVHAGFSFSLLVYTDPRPGARRTYDSRTRPGCTRECACGCAIVASEEQDARCRPPPPTLPLDCPSLEREHVQSRMRAGGSKCGARDSHVVAYPSPLYPPPFVTAPAAPSPPRRCTRCGPLAAPFAGAPPHIRVLRRRVREYHVTAVLLKAQSVHSPLCAILDDYTRVQAARVRSQQRNGAERAPRREEDEVYRDAGGAIGGRERSEALLDPPPAARACTASSASLHVVQRGTSTAPFSLMAWREPWQTAGFEVRVGRLLRNDECCMHADSTVRGGEELWLGVRAMSRGRRASLSRAWMMGRAKRCAADDDGVGSSALMMRIVRGRECGWCQRRLRRRRVREFTPSLPFPLYLTFESIPLTTASCQFARPFGLSTRTGGARASRSFGMKSNNPYK